MTHHAWCNAIPDPYDDRDTRGPCNCGAERLKQYDRLAGSADSYEDSEVRERLREIAARRESGV